MSPRAQIVRMCVSCRRKEDRLVLIRIGIDANGLPVRWQGTGRSAYIHAEKDCIERITKKGTLDRSLKRRLDESARERLREELLCQLR